MREQLQNNNYIYDEDYKKSDIVIVNTCSVTNTSDNNCQKTIRDIKRDNPNCLLMVCGCSAENHREQYNNLDIDILIGNVGKKDVVSLIENYIQNHQEYMMFSDTKNRTFENMRINNFNLTRAFVKIGIVFFKKAERSENHETK